MDHGGVLRLLQLRRSSPGVGLLLVVRERNRAVRNEGGRREWRAVEHASGRLHGRVALVGVWCSGHEFAGKRSWEELGRHTCLTRVLESASVSVSTVGEVSARDALGNFNRWEVGNVLTIHRLRVRTESGSWRKAVELRKLLRGGARLERRLTEVVRLLLKVLVSRVENGKNGRVLSDRSGWWVSTGERQLLDGLDLAGVDSLQHRGQSRDRVDRLQQLSALAQDSTNSSDVSLGSKSMQRLHLLFNSAGECLASLFNCLFDVVGSIAVDHHNRGLGAALLLLSVNHFAGTR